MIIGQYTDLVKEIGKSDFNLIDSFVKRIKNNQTLTDHWYQLDDTLKVIVLSKSRYEQDLFEIHKKFIDIHLVLAGEDILYLGDKEDFVIKEINNNEDYSLCQAKTILNIKLDEGLFALIFPEELHSNRIINQNTLKMVVKKHYNV